LFNANMKSTWNDVRPYGLKLNESREQFSGFTLFRGVKYCTWIVSSFLQ
jgi:hypothetical protein